MMVSSHRVLNDCTLSLFNSTFRCSLRFKTDSSVSLTLKYSKKNPCALPSRERAFSYCAASSSKKSLLLESLLMIIFRPLAISQSGTSNCVCNLIPLAENDVFSSAIDFADSHPNQQVVCFVSCSQYVVDPWLQFVVPASFGTSFGCFPSRVVLLLAVGVVGFIIADFVDVRGVCETCRWFSLLL